MTAEITPIAAHAIAAEAEGEAIEGGQVHARVPVGEDGIGRIDARPIGKGQDAGKGEFGARVDHLVIDRPAQSRLGPELERHIHEGHFIGCGAPVQRPIHHEGILRRAVVQAEGRRLLAFAQRPPGDREQFEGLFLGLAADRLAQAGRDISLWIIGQLPDGGDGRGHQLAVFIENAIVLAAGRFLIEQPGPAVAGDRHQRDVATGIHEGKAARDGAVLGLGQFHHDLAAAQLAHKGERIGEGRNRQKGKSGRQTEQGQTHGRHSRFAPF